MKDYVKGLIRTNGVDGALRIAENCIRASEPGSFNIVLTEKEMKRNNGFWKQVRGLIKKQMKR